MLCKQKDKKSAIESSSYKIFARLYLLLFCRLLILKRRQSNHHFRSDQHAA